LRSIATPGVRFLHHASSRKSYDPAQLISAASKPVLILQGLSDLKVGEDDAFRLAQAQPEAKLVLLPGTHHVLSTGCSRSFIVFIARGTSGCITK
jgi:pimeloyl-ACP methyl ester carboxylesterase